SLPRRLDRRNKAGPDGRTLYDGELLVVATKRTKKAGIVGKYGMRYGSVYAELLALLMQELLLVSTALFMLLVFFVFQVPDMVQVCGSKSRKWKFLSMQSTSVNSVGRCDFLCFKCSCLLLRCPYNYAVKRKAVGIWGCKDCGKVKAGGAYTLK
ncbi:hypothetical protein GW17_00050525, partial [Ensete ventricosum]